MMNFRVVAFAAIASAGFVAYQAPPASVYAASNSTSSSQNQTEEPPSHAALPPGAASYARHCAVCHGDQRQGNPPAIPSLVGIGKKKTEQQITDLIHKGNGPMPAFPKLQDPELTALLKFLTASSPTEKASLAPTATSAMGSQIQGSPVTAAGRALFQQNCAFCHGRDAAGGETGPDLTRSKLVAADVKGDKISEVVSNGRPEKKMPAFNFSSQELLSLADYIHAQTAQAVAHKGSRRGVDVADLQTGNVEAGKQYFNGAGTCSKCHSPSGDLRGIATRFEGLQLEERMLYPRDVKGKVTVTLPSGKTISGTLAYLDEFTVGLRNSDGVYESWPVVNVKYAVDSPVTAHADLFPQYTDDDVHNLMAYLQTLR